MQQTKLPRPFPNVTPVANKYLAEKEFAKEKEAYKNHIKNAHGLIDQSSPILRPHGQEHVRQKHIKEHELAIIEQENQRLRSRMSSNGAYVNTHNDYVIHSLNVKKRHRDAVLHRHEIERLQKQIKQTRTYYPKQEYEHDFVKQQDLKKRMSKFHSNNK